MLGGVLWIAHAIAVALMPAGCIGAECDIRPMRDSTAVAPLFIAAVLLIGAGLATVVSRAKRAGRFGVSGRIGQIAAVAGVATILSVSVVQGIMFDGDFPLMPYFVIPAGLVAVIGFLLLGIAMLRSGVLPRWTALLLVIGALALLGFNDQNAQALLAIPFGIAWVAAGYVLREGKQPGGRVSPPPSPVLDASRGRGKG